MYRVLRQILSVVRATNKSQVVSAWFKSSRLYSLFRCMHIQENMRLQAYRRDPNATAGALQFHGHLLRNDEAKLQMEV